MLIPQIIFNEAGVGVQPVLTNVRNRIGIVGEFSRGPANEFRYIDGFTNFAKVYGSDLRSGSLGFQAAWDQGARDFGIVRVLGNRTPACGQLIVGGIATTNNNINLSITGIGVPVASLSSYFRNDIEASGIYTGTGSGRYVFVVTDSSTDTAVEFKYKFIPFTTFRETNDAIASVDTATLAAITTAPGITAGEGVFTLDTTLAGTQTIAIEEGISIDFGDAGDDLIFDTDDQVFTLIAEYWTFNIPISQNDSAVEISNKLIDALSGNDPLGTITSQISYVPGTSNIYTNTIDFCFDDSIIPGAEGNAYYYKFDLDTPDGTFNVDVYYNGTTNPNVLLSIDPDAGLLEPGDPITLPANTSFTTTFTPGSVITTVTGSGTLADPYVITLDNAIEPPSDIAAVDAEPTTFEDSNATSSGISLSNYQQFAPFTGGINGPRVANTTLYTFTGTPLIAIQSFSPGGWGNNLRLDIDPAPNGTWQMTITDLEATTYNPVIASETYTIDLSLTDAVDAVGEIDVIKSSRLIRAFFIPKVIDPLGFDVNLLTEIPSRIAPAISSTIITDTEDPAHVSYFGPSRLGNISLESGSDGPILSENDYVQAIRQLEGTNTHIILAPGIDTRSPAVQTQLVTSAENGTENDGLKIAVLNARQGLKPAAAQRETQSINNSRAIMVAGWSTYAGQPSARRYSLSPDALYAGLLATIGFQISPAARTSAGPIDAIFEIDTAQYSSNQSLQLYTDARLEVLYSNINLGGFFFLNGSTTSSNIAWNKVVIRRTYDIIRQDLYTSLQSYQSEPHTKVLRRQIETSINAYFQTLLRNGKIANALPAICNDSNNPPENFINGNVNVSINFLPLYAADYINITISRNSDGGLQIGDDA